jgi:molybdopterin synthase sulfur carrier subunit
MSFFVSITPVGIEAYRKPTNCRKKERKQMPTVFIPSSLRRYTAGQAKAEVAGGTVHEALENLDRQYPGVKSRLYDDNGQIKRYVNVFVNDEEIRALKGADTPLSERDEISIVPAMAGGGR